MDNCLVNLKKHNFKVDIIVAHTCPYRLVESFILNKPVYYGVDPTTKMLEHIVTVTTFEDFYCGHWHIDIDYNKEYHFMYERILKIA
jgi:hypothetical protein